MFAVLVTRWSLALPRQVFAFANQTTFPSYGYFLELGYTTWPERWDVKSGDSLMHGCGIPGIHQLQGITLLSL